MDFITGEFQVFLYTPVLTYHGGKLHTHRGFSWWRRGKQATSTWGGLYFFPKVGGFIIPCLEGTGRLIPLLRRGQMIPQQLFRRKERRRKEKGSSIFALRQFDIPASSDVPAAACNGSIPCMKRRENGCVLRLFLVPFILSGLLLLPAQRDLPLTPPLSSLSQV